MANTKIRRPRVTEEVRQAIVNFATGMSAGQIHEVMKGEERERAWKVPSLRTLQKIRKEAAARADTAEFRGKEALWNNGILSEDPEFVQKHPEMTAEAIEAIAVAQRWCDDAGRVLKVHGMPTYAVTVRQALWIARLHRLVRRFVQGEEEAELLWLVCFFYASYEARCSKSRVKMDTSEWDKALRTGREAFSRLLAEKWESDDALAGAASYLARESRGTKEV